MINKYYYVVAITPTINGIICSPDFKKTNFYKLKTKSKLQVLNDFQIDYNLNIFTSKKDLKIFKKNVPELGHITFTSKYYY